MLICKSGPLCPPEAPPAHFRGVFNFIKGGKRDLVVGGVVFSARLAARKNIFIFETAAWVFLTPCPLVYPQKNRPKKKIKKKIRMKERGAFYP